IATEKEAKNVEELKQFLTERGHPLSKKILEAPVVTVEKAAEAPTISATPQMEATVTLPELPMTMGGFSFILKNVKIKAEKLIIKRIEERK
ncbi:MAG: acetyl-CoA decarbonylase/synthase complex subunit beta, partial [Candidatus Methanomethylicia archaeon]